MDENKSASELNEALKGMWDSLTDEQKEKAKQCQSMDELMQLAGKLGVELPDEILDSVAGGSTSAFDNGFEQADHSGYVYTKLWCYKCGKTHKFQAFPPVLVGPEQYEPGYYKNPGCQLYVGSPCKTRMWVSPSSGALHDETGAIYYPQNDC